MVGLDSLLEARPDSLGEIIVMPLIFVLRISKLLNYFLTLFWVLSLLIL